MSKDNRGSSAHANGGAAKVQKRFSLAARHRFFGQAPKKWGRIAGQAIDHRPAYRRTRRRHNDKAALSCAVTCAPFSWAEAPPPTARSTPFLCSCAKKRGGAPKKRAFGCRHGTCSVPPASPTNSKPQHNHRLRRADLSARSTHQAPPPSRAKMSKDNRGSSAHANGGAAGVKKRFSLAARHRFFGQAPKKWGRTAGQGNDNLPTYRRTRRNVKKRGNPRRGFPLGPPPAL